jgi:hypothetical protein
MTATELFEALKGVPEEALCKTIRYHPVGCAWYGNMGQVLDDHAAALQRDAMTEWLCGFGDVRFGAIGDLFRVSIPCTLIDYNASTRIHALAAACRYAACRYVAEEQAMTTAQPRCERCGCDDGTLLPYDKYGKHLTYPFKVMRCEWCRNALCEEMTLPDIRRIVREEMERLNRDK